MREADALGRVDLLGLAADLAPPVLLLLGEKSPSWAGDITRELAAALRDAEVAILPDIGHEAIDSAPALVVSKLEQFFDRD